MGGLPGALLAALIKRSSGELSPRFAWQQQQRETASSGGSPPPGGTEAMKGEYIERFDALPPQMNERITLEVRRVMRDPTVRHPGNQKSNRAAKFWEKLGFELD